MVGRAVARRTRSHARRARPGRARRAVSARVEVAQRREYVGALASGACGQPEPGWHAAARRHRYVDGRRLADRPGRPPVVVKRLARAGRGRPGRAQRPAPLRLLAARGRRRHRRRSSSDPRAALGRADRRRGGRGRHHDDPGVGRGRRAAAGCSCAHALGRFAGARPRRGRAWLARDQLRDRLARVERARRLADAGPDHGRRRRRPPVAAAATSCWPQLDALPQVPQHGDAVPAQPAGPRRRRRRSPSTGRRSGTGPVGGRPRLLRARRARGVRAAARRLPARPARRARHAATRSRSGPG